MTLGKRNSDGYTCFHVACQTNNKRTVQLLIDMGVNMNLGESKAGKTGLHLACEAGLSTVVKLLVNQSGINLDEQSYDGQTALIAAYHKRLNNIVGWYSKKCRRLIFQKRNPKVWAFQGLGLLIILLCFKLETSSSWNSGLRRTLCSFMQYTKPSVKSVQSQTHMCVNMDKGESWTSTTGLHLACEVSLSAVAKLLIKQKERGALRRTVV